MISELRRAFNRSWTEARYASLLAAVGARAGVQPQFPVSETPCFFSRALLGELSAAGAELVSQILDRPDARAAADGAVPPAFRGPNQDENPTFVQVDFGVVKDTDGGVRPKLVELQAFASIYGLQAVLAEEYRRAFDLRADLDPFLGGHDRASYHARLREALVGAHDPAEVVLMEIDPLHQKTLPDFRVTEALWGVRAVDTADVEREGRALFYRRDGLRTRIRRVYNRVIPDELQRKQVALPFDYRDDLDVEWAGHPAWFFRVSKFSIPFLTHPCVPRTWFLDELEAVPDDRENFVLKPLFSFAGGGIIFGPTDADLAAVPAASRHDYILQERVAFTPLIDTPHGPTQVEIRIMYVWTDALRPVIALLRMGRGKMMGVDHNKALRWVGASAAFAAGVS